MLTAEGGRGHPGGTGKKHFPVGVDGQKRLEGGDRGSSGDITFCRVVERTGKGPPEGGQWPLIRKALASGENAWVEDDVHLRGIGPPGDRDPLLVGGENREKGLLEGVAREFKE